MLLLNHCQKGAGVMVQRSEVRLQDVADRAGVSLATASRVFADPGYGGRAGLRTRVATAAAELGYRPNPHARALASATSSNVGLVVHDVRDAYFAALSGGVITVADRNELLVNIVCTFRDPEKEVEYVRRLAAQRVRALILAGSSFRSTEMNALMRAELEAYARGGGSVVSLSPDRGVGHTVCIDNEGGMRRLVHALAEQGHSRFGTIAGPARLNAVRDRLQGIRLGLKDAGITMSRNDVVHQDLSREGGALGASILLGRSEPPTCLIGVADVVAVGAQTWAIQHGFNVPEDVSIAGFGNIAATLDAMPPLTTVEVPLERVGEIAMELALRAAKPRHAVEVEGTVVVRGSTAAPVTHRAS